jgi:hypothetical protein
VLVTIELDSGEVTATAYHPFWVIQGLDLDNRPPVSHLLPTEDRGQSLPGRWVNSHELMEHDIVFIRAGGPTSIRRVAHRQVNMSVCNLTIRGLHTFCVGTTQVLVHNESGTVGPINPGGAAPKAKSAFPSDPNDLTKQLGVPPSKVTTTPDGTARMLWEPNSNTRIRYESHPEGLTPSDPGFNARHHGEHYHVEMKPDGMTWGQAQRRGLITKGYPDGYTPGSGTGFLPNEPFPGN